MATSDDTGSAVLPVLHVGGICELDDALLLVRHGPGPAGGEWHLPSVALRAGETLAEAVVRACIDLGGCDTLCGPFVGWTEQPDTSPAAVRMYFEAVLRDHVHATAEPPDGSAAAEARFVPLWEVPELRLAAGLAEFLADQELIDTVV